MDNSSKKKALMQPRTLAELLPGIKDILTEDAIRSLSMQRNPRPTFVPTQLTDKVTRPLTIAECRALTGSLQKKQVQPTPSARPKLWNSSVKVDKKKSVTATAEGQLKSRTVRKVLNFQPKPSKKPEVAAANTWKTMTNSVNKKSFPIQGKTKALPEMSGIFEVAATPVIKIPHSIIKITTPKCNSDDSFLLTEKQVNEFEDKCNLLDEEPVERIAEVSPPFSIPFKEYRSIQDHLNNTSLVDNSITNNNTLTYDKESALEKNNKRKESVIVSVCEVDSSNNNNSKYFHLLELEKKVEDEIKTIDNMMDTLAIRKKSLLQSLHNIRSKLKAAQSSEVVKKEDSKNLVESPHNGSTVIKTKSPSYKIQRKSKCSSKNICKSMPNISDAMHTPMKSNSLALSMYMEIKDQMCFLSTPLSTHRNAVTPDTPAITSRNLQKQLDKLFNE